MEEYINYESLEYGNYIIGDEQVVFVENVRYNRADFNKLYVQRIKLPEGKSNVVYLMSKNFASSLQMLSGNDFQIPTNYRRVFYPKISYGAFMGKRYRMNLMKERNIRDKQIRDIGKMAYTARVLPNNVSDNIFFITSDLYQSISPIVSRVTTKRAYTEFFPEFMKMINSLTPEKGDKGKENDNNRILIIDSTGFAFNNSAPLKENKTNPLFLLYLTYLRTRDLSKLDVDIDILICHKNMFMKFNPSQLTKEKWNNFRRFLFRIMNVNLDEYTDSLSSEEKQELEESSTDKTISNIVSETVKPYTQNVNPSTKVVLQNAIESKMRQAAVDKISFNNEMNKAVKGLPASEEKPSVFATTNAMSVLNKNQEEYFKALGGYNPLTKETGMFVDDEDEEQDYEEWEDDIKSDVIESMQDDKDVAEEVIDEIQDHTVPMKRKTSPINSKRDEKLREEQKKVIVNNETIEQILERDSTNVPIQTTDKSKVMHTSNQNMKKITFANFDKTYLDELYVKDIVACFDMLKDKDNPFYITNIEIHDTSTALDYKETWTVTLRDETNKRHVVKVDIPKFQNDRFMLINGTKFIILKQNFYNPLVKDTPDTVIITTNYNKVTVTRRATKSLSSVERIFSLIKKSGDNKVFVSGDSSIINLRYLSTLEFDELGKRLFSFKSNGCELYFSRKYLEENFQVSNVNEDEFVIGKEGDNPIIINEDTGLDRNGRTIIQIIEQYMPDEYRQKYEQTKGPVQTMYVEAKMAGEFIPAIAILMVWIGLTKTLDKMGIYWKFDNTTKRIPKDTFGKKYIRFSDGILEYESKTFAELIMNGVAKMHPEQYMFADFDTEVGYEEFIYSQWGSYNGINELINFNEFLVDPITKQVCKDMMLPDDAAGLLIHAVKLLSDNAYVSKASDSSYRVRSIEMIPAILYGCLAAQYKAHVKSGRRTPMTLNQRCVIKKLLAEKTVEPYSTLNPVVEVGKMNTISTKGYKGSNSEFSYDEEKRSYDPNAVGKIAMTSSPDANVGINRALVIEPTISNARGYRDQDVDVEDLKDVNLFSATEMLTPGTIRGDDPIRSAINLRAVAVKLL